MLRVCDVTESWGGTVLERTEGVIGGLVVAPMLCNTFDDTRGTVSGAGLKKKIISHIRDSSLAKRTSKKSLSCFSTETLLQPLHRRHQPPTGWKEAVKAKKLLAGILGLEVHPRFVPLQFHCGKSWCRTGWGRSASLQLEAQFLSLLEQFPDFEIGYSCDHPQLGRCR